MKTGVLLLGCMFFLFLDSAHGSCNLAPSKFICNSIGGAFNRDCYWKNGSCRPFCQEGGPNSGYPELWANCTGKKEGDTCTGYCENPFCKARRNLTATCQANGKWSHDMRCGCTWERLQVAELQNTFKTCHDGPIKHDGSIDTGHAFMYTGEDATSTKCVQDCIDLGARCNYLALREEADGTPICVGYQHCRETIDAPTRGTVYFELPPTEYKMMTNIPDEWATRQWSCSEEYLLDASMSHNGDAKDCAADCDRTSGCHYFTVSSIGWCFLYSGCPTNTLRVMPSGSVRLNGYRQYKGYYATFVSKQFLKFGTLEVVEDGSYGSEDFSSTLGEKKSGQFLPIVLTVCLGTVVVAVVVVFAVWRKNNNPTTTALGHLPQDDKEGSDEDQTAPQTLP
eukprot:TRINITY_DN66366_c4_g1_i2.p2 TRINITY_DN66366_c4_g1~~TRINITY_DN66366_c4_g1_i2.p2  ORF type:complete len:395 (+),score=39.79 TRINITY_DN66366_c4_g1_i2:113-1297(+)